MKKTFLKFGVVLVGFVLSPVVAFAYSLTPTTVTSGATIMTFGGITASESIIVFSPSLGTPYNIVTSSYNNYSWDDVWAMVSFPEGLGEYKAVVVNNSIGVCTGLTYNECILSTEYLGTNFLITVSLSSVLFGYTAPSDLMASVGGVSSNVYVSALPYLLLSVGVFVAFMIVQKLVDMLGLAYDQKTGREPRATRKRGRKKKE